MSLFSFLSPQISLSLCTQLTREQGRHAPADGNLCFSFDSPKPELLITRRTQEASPVTGADGLTQGL